jgi:glycerol-1-phosphate dehydrogenase [NAD(P)+]
VAENERLEQADAAICAEAIRMTATAPKSAVKKDWNSFIRDVISGAWRDPQSGERCKVPFETIRIEETLDGGAADLVAPLNVGRKLAVVSDTNTVEAMGRRVAKELKGWASVEEIVFPGNTHCDEPTIAQMQERTRHVDGCVVVGSGSLSDTVKFAMFKTGRKYASFATAASMNGYGAMTASVTLANGYKTSVPAQAPRGVFVDLEVNAAAPTWLPAAGLGDSLCRPVAQVEWWACHRIFDTYYSQVPFDFYYVENDEPEMIRTAPDLAKHSIEANGYLYRVMTEASFGNNVLGTSHSGSMGEHQVSHWIDMFAGDAHPGTTHGQQVGVASLTIARLHQMLFDMPKPPRVKPTKIDRVDFQTRYGADIGGMMFDEAKKKALDQNAADACNARLEEIWPELCVECKAMMMPSEEISTIIASAGGPTSATELGLPREIWRQSMKYARDVRNRWSFLDLADDAGLLDEFLLNDPQ